MTSSEQNNSVAGQNESIAPPLHAESVQPVDPNAELSDIASRRLHPMSWLFVLIQQLKSFALPILILMITGRGEDSSTELIGLIIAMLLAVYSIVQYLTYRYGIDDGGLVIRSGIFQRTMRHVPFSRVQNVSLHRSVLHRLFGVAEVTLESAGGLSAEARMRVLKLTDAQFLETLIRDTVEDRSQQPAVADAETDSQPAIATRTLLNLSVGDVVRIGLISNRGMVVVAAGFGFIWQLGEQWRKQINDVVSESIKSGILYAYDLHLGWAAYTLMALSIFAAFVIAIRLFSVALALLQFYGFNLSERGRRLSIERGLLTRIRGSLPRHRIQAWSLSESLLHRWFNRRSLKVDRVVLERGHESKSLRDLIPIGKPAQIDLLINHLIGRNDWPITQWQSLHPKAWRRQFFIPALIVAAISGLTVLRGSYFGYLILLILPILLIRAIVWARYAGYAMTDHLIAVRSGWLEKQWRFMEIRKLQGLILKQSPFDRRHAMATLVLDTAGASPVESALQIRYLPIDEARYLKNILAQRIDMAVVGE